MMMMRMERNEEVNLARPARIREEDDEDGQADAAGIARNSWVFKATSPLCKRTVAAVRSLFLTIGSRTSLTKGAVSDRDRRPLRRNEESTE